MIARAIAAACVLAAASPAAAEPRDVQIELVLQQGGLVLTRDDVTAGGFGAGVGVQVRASDNLVQVDASALWLLGNATAIRVAVGRQRAGRWAPAAWVVGTTLWGDRLEILDGPERPRRPAWAIGVRGSPLRFRSRLGTISALEPGVGTDLDGVALELTVLQVGAAW